MFIIHYYYYYNMSRLFKLCNHCDNKPATVKCNDCNAKFCYACDTKVHKNSKMHTTEVIPYT